MKKFILFGSVLAAALALSLACNSTSATGPYNSANGSRNGPPTATFQPTPAFVSSWPVTGINGMAAGNGYIYTAQAGDGVTEVQLFTSPGSAAATWTAYGSTPFAYPNGVAVGPTNNDVYVLDAGTCSPSNSECDTTPGAAVYVFSSSSTATPVTTWSGYGSGTFNAPAGIAVDSSSDVYVADLDNYEVEEFNSTGGTVNYWNGGGYLIWPAAITLDSNNYIYVVDAYNGVVWKLSSITGTPTYWPLAYPLGEGESPNYGIGVDGNGNVFVADYNQALVEVYTNGGELIGEITGNEGSAVPFMGPVALMITGGNIYVGDYDKNNVQIFGPDNY